MALIVDLFAGGGGASLGIRQALGRDPDIAINHDAQAVAMHAANHPGTRHFCQDVWKVLPLWATQGQPVDLLWASPDCKHFSKAKGGKPREQGIRDLAWVVVEWAKAARPAVIILENVEEFRTWGPLDKDGHPVKELAGSTFAEWQGQLRRLGYKVEHRELRACDYGAPTIRKRLFLIARRDGLPIVWPEPTHGPGRPLPWRTAAECIDWSLPCPSIFDRKRPLAENTLKRIAAGIKRFVLEAAEPFIVTYYGPKGEEFRGQGLDAALATMTTENRHALVMPGLVGVGGRAGQSRPRGAGEPMATITAKGDTALVAPYLMTNTSGHAPSGPGGPLPTLTTGNHQYLAAPTLIQTGYGERPGHWRCPACGCTYDLSDLPTCGCVKCGSADDPVLIPGQAPRAPGLDKPLGTVVAGGAKHALVSAFLAKHYGGVVGSSAPAPLGTVTAVDHHSLVTAHLESMRGRSVGAAADNPTPTITGHAHEALIAAHLTKYYGTATGTGCAEPMHTITAGGQPARPGTGHKMGLVYALLTKYYGQGIGQALQDPAATVTAKDRMGLVYVTVQGQPYVIADIGLRMLQPRELFRAQGFPDTYIIGDDPAQGLALTKTAQVRLCGNSVCPPNAEALVRANCAGLAQEEAA